MKACPFQTQQLIEQCFDWSNCASKLSTLPFEITDCSVGKVFWTKLMKWLPGSGWN